MSAGGKLSFRRRVRDVGDDENLPLVDGGDNPPPLDELVPPAWADADIDIEVGPGKGAFLIAATEARPDVFTIGIEAAPAYARLAASRLAETGRDNGLLLIDNATLYLQQQVPPGALARLHVYFPDPWPKRRHRGRRFFTEDAPALAHRVLRRDGLLLVATDNPAYAGQIVRVLGSSPLLRRDHEAEAALVEAGPGAAFTPTDFERKYIVQGRVIRRTAWRRVDSDG